LRIVRSSPGSRAVAALVAACCGCAWGQCERRGAGLTFTEMSLQSGVVAGWQAPPGVFASTMIGGAAAADVNRDGWTDLFVLSGGATPDRLFICVGPDANGFVRYEERAAEWGVAARHIGAGVSVTDVNGDGWPDLYITAHGDETGLRPGQHRLLVNNGSAEPGVAGFTDMTEHAGVAFSSPDRSDGFGSSWADVNGDGLLDVFVAGWVGNGGGNRLFLANPDGRFTDATDTHVLADLMPVNGFTPRFEDIDQDGWPDLLLAADFRTSRLLRNDGSGRFLDVTQAWGTSLESNGMGATTDDFNNDGLVDWYVTSVHRDGSTLQDGNKLYLNRGDGGFEETAAAAGVDDGGWGWGAASGDLDLDTDVDIVETNGWSGSMWLNERSYVFLNDGDGTSFSEVSQQAGLFHIGQGRGVVLFDADNDGDLDAIIVSNSGPLRLYRNNLPDADARGWVSVRLETGASAANPPAGVGARVAVTAGGVTRWRFVGANSTYLSQGPIGAHFGLGGASSIDRIEIFWPNGGHRVIESPGRNRAWAFAACDADLTGDHAARPEDVGVFVQAFVAGERRADLTADRRHDFFDVAAYLRAYAAGCPADPAR
jgi:hypothetical protein